MRIIEKGLGAPLVLIPPLQGRWEYLRPTVEALARSFRVITFSLCGEPGSGMPLDQYRGLEGHVSQVLQALDAAHADRAIMCGISFGGVVALLFAAEHPGRTASLILASTPGPGWRLRPRHEMYARVPWLFGPVFMLEAPWRFRAEFAAALPNVRDRGRFALLLAGTFLRAPLSLRRMAARARLIASPDLVAACSRVTAPTLVVTGEPGLDRVVPVEGSSAYATLIPRARRVVLGRTGHHGTITRPQAFADLVRNFVEHPRDATAA